MSIPAFLLHYGSLAACVLVLTACVCRVDLMRHSRNRWAWFVLYALFAVYAMGTALGIWRDTDIGWDDAAGIASIAYYMMLTRRLWVDGPPPETVKKGQSE